MGMIGAHVKDFLISGDESNPRRVEAMSIKWPPWKCMPFTHCGIGQKPDYAFMLDHAE